MNVFVISIEKDSRVDIYPQTFLDYSKANAISSRIEEKLLEETQNPASYCVSIIETELKIRLFSIDVAERQWDTLPGNFGAIEDAFLSREEAESARQEMMKECFGVDLQVYELKLKDPDS